MMLLKNLTKAYISTVETQNNHGEYEKQWTFLKIVFLNLQQDINELDRQSNGEINYDIYKARTDIDYKLENGYGVSFTDISKSNDFIPEYKILSQNKIGNSITYRLERYYGD